jgi:hypothetical protein
MMTIFKNFVVGFVLFIVIFCPSVTQAQNQGSMNVGRATITVGSGMVLMMLPDTGSMITEGDNNTATHFPVRETFKFSDNFKETGLNVNTSIAVPVGGMTFSLGGFWANVKGKDSFACVPQPGGLCVIEPLVDDPGRMQTQGTIFGQSILVDSKRDVNYWGIALESKKTPVANSHYLAWGLDVRGIYQDLDSTMAGAWAGPFLVTYKESLKTSYYGGYLAWCGDYSPSPLKNWGLESSFRLQGGLYYADVRYSGRLANSGTIIGGGGDPISALSLSTSKLAFIGGLTLGISKQLGTRTKLSLNSGYEYYSYVPQMKYNTADRNSNPLVTNRRFGTAIGTSYGSSVNIGLTLTIQL